jgi:surfactin synthase thioesterase subunit
MSDRKQIVCFTYAGGNASFFNDIEGDLPDFEFMKLEYAGHGTRHKEPLYQNFDELADDLYAVLETQYDGSEYALFGYSMGTISMVEVLRRIIDKNALPLPNHVFIAAHEPKTKAELKGYSQVEMDELVKDRTIRFGAVPENLLNNKSFWRMYLPLYRADYSIIGKYEFESLSLKSTIPATVFYSETDTKLDDMKLWGNYFIREINYCQYEGTHFFIQNHHAEMARVIEERINGRINK